MGVFVRQRAGVAGRGLPLRTLDPAAAPSWGGPQEDRELRQGARDRKHP